MGSDGISITDFCRLVDLITERFGREVTIGPMDLEGKMHFFLGKEDLGYINTVAEIIVYDGTNPLVWRTLKGLIRSGR